MSKYYKAEDMENLIINISHDGEVFELGMLALQNLPTIDIVRCKDCRWYRDFDGCFFSTAECEPEHFCSWGQSADETLREICRDFIGIVEETRKDNE